MVRNSMRLLFYTNITKIFDLRNVYNHLTRYMTSSMIVFYPSEPQISSSNHNWISRALADGTTTYSIVIVKMSTQRESKLHAITLLVLTDERELELW